MNIARGDGSYMALMASYKKIQLLILDEWMHQPISEIRDEDILEIVESRYQEPSTIFVAQSEPAEWHQHMSSGMIANAILDRIFYNSYELMLNGDVNMWKRMGLRQ